MPAFGLSQAGKNARGQINQLPFDLQALMKQAIDRGNSTWNNSAEPNDWFKAYLQNIIMNPNESAVADPTRVWEYGQQTMPGVDDALKQIMDQLGVVRNTAAGIPGRQQTTDLLNSNIESLTGATFNKNNFNRDQINNTYDALQKMSDGVYTDLGRNINDTYGKAKTDTGVAFDDALTQLNRLLPGGDMAAARSARAFAPAMSAAKRRLRASGIDPNSPEAAGLLQTVDVNRARSADDILSQNMNDFVSQGNQLRLGKANILRQLGIDEGALTRDNVTKMMGSTAGNLTGRAQGLMNNEDDFYKNYGNIVNLRNSSIQNDRNMGLQDLDVQQEMMDLISNAVMSGVDLKSKQFQMAFNNLLTGQNQKNSAASQLGAFGQHQQGLGMQLASQGGEFARAAFPMFQTSLDNEAANSNWAGKLLTGVGAGMLSMIPGVGPMLSQGVTGAFGGNGVAAPGSYNPGSGAATPPFLPQQSQSGYNPPAPTFSDFVSGMTKMFGRNKPRTSQISVTSQRPVPEFVY